MNKNILNALLAGTFTLGLASCGENTWNDHYLDGFEEGVNYDKSIEASYSLTAADYSAISSLMQAKATTDAEKAAAKAIGTNLYFDKTSVFPASVAIPAYLATSTFPYYLASNGSTVDIVYDEAAAVPEELTALAGALTYTVSAGDYSNVWGSESAYISSFAPDATAAANLPSILAANLPDATEGTYAVVTYNTASQNPMFGLPAEVPPSANLFTGDFKAGQYLMVDEAGSRLAGNLAADKNYGYLPSAAISLSDGSISGFDIETQGWNFISTGVAGEYYITDMSGRYYYQSGTYNSFNVAASVSNDDGYIWLVSSEADNTWKIINKGVSKWIQTPSGSYDTWGSYSNARGVYPQLYVVDAESAKEPVEVPTYTPASITENAVYYFNGSKWSVADGVAVLNPADYTAIGVSNNKLVDPEIYIPMYLKNKLPYAQSGDQEYVVYNGTKADLFVFDGTVWTLNNNGLETVTGRFSKSSDAWGFVKYIGKAIFNVFEADQIERDRSYIFVSGDICATVIDKNKNYGYLYTTPVSISNGQIVMASDVNAFTFASSCTIDGSEVKAPEGKFLIRDSYGRYLYMKGTYSSVNLATAPAVEGGQIDVAYLWSATRNADGSWSITCDRGEGNSNTFFYSKKYDNFAAYASGGSDDVLPSLYMLDI